MSNTIQQVYMCILQLFLIFFCTGLAAQDTYESFNPGEVWNDTDGMAINAHGGGITIVGDTYYWFGEHKTSGSQGNKSWIGVHVYSSKDLYNWNNEGVALDLESDPGSKLQMGSVIERPKVIYNEKTGKFVMWFHHELKGQGYDAALAGVAVADSITGPYTYLNSFRLHPRVWPENFTAQQRKKVRGLENAQWTRQQKTEGGFYLARDFEEGQMSRDMTVFVDDDGTAYHITASEENGTLLISQLAPDYLSLSDHYVRVFSGGDNEAPAIFKKEGKYYMITSGLTGWDPNAARSAVAEDMLGPWKSLGNPVRGTPKEMSTTFHSQSTYVLPVIGKESAYIFMADRWRPDNPIDGRYVWLPVEFDGEKPVLKWYPEWGLDFFEKQK